MPVNRIHSLFFSAWYPHRYDAMSGLFVRKHADAVSRFCKVTVLYVHADEHITQREIRFENFNAVHEVYVYFPSRPGFLQKLSKPFQFASAYLTGIRKVIARYGRPDIVHVNILTRTALPALYLKFTRNIPYVVTEHWSRYLPSRNSYHGFLRKLLTRYAVSKASALMPVTANLMHAMRLHKLTNPLTVIVNNVADDFFFSPPTLPGSGNTHILHISCFDDEPKNISGLLRVYSRLLQLRSDHEFTLAGTGKDIDSIKHLAETLGIMPKLRFTGELTPQEIAVLLHQSDFLVLFSNNENAPVVISESLACGKPVVATRVGGIPEMINPDNGILVNAGDEDGLLEALNTMIDNHRKYDAMAIQEAARAKYAYSQVGEAIVEVYTQIPGINPQHREK